MSQVFIDREKIKETIQEFRGFGSEEVLTIAIAALAFLHTKKVATISLNNRGLHGSIYASEEFNPGEFFWPFIEDCEHILSDRIDLVEGDQPPLPKLPPLNLSASSSNSSKSRKTSPPAIISDPIKSPGFFQGLPEPSLSTSSSADFINGHTTAPSIQSATLCPRLPELESSLHSRPHSAPLVPSSSHVVFSDPIVICEDKEDEDELSVDEDTVKVEEDVNMINSAGNLSHPAYRGKSQKAALDLKHKLLLPAPTTNKIVTHIHMNFKSGKSTKRKRSQGYDSIANSIYLIEKLSSASTLRSLAIFHYIKKFFELVGDQKDSKRAVAELYKSIGSTIKNLGPTFDDEFNVSKLQILKLCSRGKFLFKIHEILGNSFLSTIIQHQIPLIKLTDSPKDERDKMIEWALTNKDQVLSLPGFLSSEELDRLENIAYDPQPTSPGGSQKGTPSKSDIPNEKVKLSLSNKRIASPINARKNTAASQNGTTMRKKRRT